MDEDDSDGGPVHQIDSNGDYQINQDDDWVGWYDSHVSKQYGVPYLLLSSYQSDWYNKEVKDPQGQTVVIGQYDVVLDVDNWWMLSSNTISVVTKIWQSDLSQQGRVVLPSNEYSYLYGKGTMGPPNAVVLIQSANARQVLHELGHNAYCAHTDPIKDAGGTLYMQNVMSYNSGHWTAGPRGPNTAVGLQDQVVLWNAQTN